MNNNHWNVIMQTQSLLLYLIICFVLDTFHSFFFSLATLTSWYLTRFIQPVGEQSTVCHVKNRWVKRFSLFEWNVKAVGRCVHACEKYRRFFFFFFFRRRCYKCTLHYTIYHCNIYHWITVSTTINVSFFNFAILVNYSWHIRYPNIY